MGADRAVITAAGNPGAGVSGQTALIRYLQLEMRSPSQKGEALTLKAVTVPAKVPTPMEGPWGLQNGETSGGHCG